MANTLLTVEEIDVNEVQGGSSRWIPLHVSAEFNSEKVIDALLNAEKINVNAESCRKCTPLHIAAEHGHTDTINALIQNRANVKVVNKNGSTPLHLAAACSKWVVMILIVNGADLLLKNKDGKTPRYLLLKHIAEDDDIKRILKAAENNLKN
ncbi:MAG: ankyrin repeat domain-containing protein [Wolbachia sp.]